jgi:NADH:ubiquinone oxidoreductase subunit E
MGTQDLMDILDALPVDQRRQIEIKGVTCFKNCGKGPTVRINGELLGNVTPELLLEVLQNNLK